MIIYLLKFSACLAVFMLFYKLFLEKESFHKFKRGYLLGTLLASIMIPLITFTTYIEATPIEIPINNSEFVTPPYVPDHMFEEEINYLPYVLWSIYIIGVLVFTIRFGINLTNIVKRIKQNPKFKNQSVFHVLLTDLIAPHTFLNYIFFNKEKYEAHKIPKEVLLHEETHAKEKHALDILFIEILQIVFWFNPLLYFIKKDIKLNHEFLADQAVINNGIQLKDYQSTLLAFSSNAAEPQLANAINYSSIKKRFTVMKTQTSKHTIWLRSLVLLPLLAILIYSFSSNKVVEKPFEENSSINHTARSIEIVVLDNGTYKIDGNTATKETFTDVINQLHQDVTPEIRNRIINIHVNDGKKVSDEEVWFIYNEAVKYGFHRIVTYNQEIIREKGNKPFALSSADSQGISQTQKPILEVSENPLKLVLNGKPTDLKHLKEDFNKITGGEKSDLIIDSNGENIKIEILKKITNEIQGNLNKATLSDGVIHDSSKTERIKNDDGTISFKSIQKGTSKDQIAYPKSINQTNPLPKIYGRICDACEINLTKEKLKNLKVETNTKEPIASFKIKFVGKPTVSVKGDRLNAQAITNLNASKKGDYIQLFDLKTPTTRIKPPVIIKLIDKSELPPPPPPPVPADATPEQKDLYKKASEEYYKKYQVVNGMVVKKEKYLNSEKHTQNLKMVVAKAPEKQQNLPTQKEVDAYNAWAKKIHSKSTTLSDKAKLLPIVDEQKLMKYSDIYNRMSQKQKSESAKFPFPGLNTNETKLNSPLTPPPPPIPANATPEQKERYKKAHEEYKQWKSTMVKKGEKSDIPPPPPPPKSPLDHVIAMAKKDATFYYEGQRISSDKAISILKNDSELNISTKNGSTNNPIVNITTNPVITDKNGKVITDIDTISEVEKNINEDKVGYVKINGTVYYYSIKNNKISYFNRWGERVNKNGEPMKPE